MSSSWRGGSLKAQSPSTPSKPGLKCDTWVTPQNGAFIGNIVYLPWKKREEDAYPQCLFCPEHMTEGAYHHPALIVGLGKRESDGEAMAYVCVCSSTKKTDFPLTPGHNTDVEFIEFQFQKFPARNAIFLEQDSQLRKDTYVDTKHVFVFKLRDMWQFDNSKSTWGRRISQLGYQNLLTQLNLLTVPYNTAPLPKYSWVPTYHLRLHKKTDPAIERPAREPFSVTRLMRTQSNPTLRRESTPPPPCSLRSSSAPPQSVLSLDVPAHPTMNLSKPSSPAKAAAIHSAWRR